MNYIRRLREYIKENPVLSMVGVAGAFYLAASGKEKIATAETALRYCDEDIKARKAQSEWYRKNPGRY